MRYLSMAIALGVLQIGTAHAAAPVDGHWKGSWSGISSLGGSISSTECRGYQGNVEMSVTAGQVSGVTNGQYQGTIAGTVAQDGKFTGKIGPYAMTGKFSGKRFTGHFNSSKCTMNVNAKPTGG